MPSNLEKKRYNYHKAIILIGVEDDQYSFTISINSGINHDLKRYERQSKESCIDSARIFAEILTGYGISKKQCAFANGKTIDDITQNVIDCEAMPAIDAMLFASSLEKLLRK